MEFCETDALCAFDDGYNWLARASLQTYLYRLIYSMVYMHTYTYIVSLSIHIAARDSNATTTIRIHVGILASVYL